ncbi:hypothetical protein IX39_10445 [Chryseobacterium formosense]|uniref:DUF3347 domain-containing protein n=1 Tax=Chryseobacterium formosense TaxID=236814 RepID=A0A085Z999_9FLAO|nr:MULTISPECIES: DUF3347 domain-containing protein [Chryseobacterium]KFF01013.1 hypothetical protein IX39_10445 [Chryseobacterium formosense]OCK50200.1 hypothetical protein BA768_06115 [Chryseobacterium sp. CBo1]SFT40825.1 Protein of unknown function [Chryseobacterium formosense]
MKKHIITFLFSIFTFLSVTAQAKTNPQLSKLYQNYIAIKSALASDDFKKTSIAAGEFMKTASSINSKSLDEKKLNALKSDAKTISLAKNIEAQRKPFYKLSEVMISIAHENKISDKTIFVQYCPMAKGSWLSNEKQIINPYYGSSMLKCGSVKSEIE